MNPILKDVRSALALLSPLWISFVLFVWAWSR